MTLSPKNRKFFEEMEMALSNATIHLLAYRLHNRKILSMTLYNDKTREKLPFTRDEGVVWCQKPLIKLLRRVQIYLMQENEYPLAMDLVLDFISVKAKIESMVPLVPGLQAVFDFLKEVLENPYSKEVHFIPHPKYREKNDL